MSNGGRKLNAATYYDQVAARWDEEHEARQNAHFRRQLRASIRDVLSRADIRGIALELGAGTGPCIDVVSPLFAKLIVTDISANMLKVLARRVEQLGLENVTPMQADACDLRAVETSSVDVVYSMGMLETISDYGRLFAESGRVLRPGGMVAGIVSNGSCPWYRLRTWIEGGQRHVRTGHLPTARELSAVMRRAGFASPDFGFWGAVPPGLRPRALIATLAAVESMISLTPLASRLAVLTFRARRL
jgi:cyclopropane fatty-acyl-phospholipid synthase-like methyltransferase